jgi:hypothetical protein
MVYFSLPTSPENLGLISKKGLRDFIRFILRLPDAYYKGDKVIRIRQ